jgi:hypothetical protein
MRALVAIQGAQFFGSIASGALSAARSLVSLGNAAASGISAAVEQATSLGEETSKSAVVFGDSAAKVMEFAKSAEAIGLSTASALQATGAFGNLFTAMGLGSQQAADYATSMTALGADLASFNNSTVDDAVQAIGAALRGEAEPIRRFGVILDDATLKQEALSQRLISSTSGALTPAIKAQAAYAAILKQTTAAQGDFARTSGSLANLGRVVQSQASNILGDVGAAFAPLFQSAVSAISSVLSAVRPFISEVAEGVRGSLATIGVAITNVASGFVSFVQTLDGVNLGQAIGDALIQGATFLAGVGDFLIANLSNVWGFASQVGGQWNAVSDIFNRAASFLSAVFNGAQAGLGVVILGFSSAFQGLAEIAQSIGQYLGFDTASIDAVVAGAQAFNSQIQSGINENLAAQQAGLAAAFGPAQAASAGQAIAGPLTTSLQAAQARAQEAASQIGQATSKPVDVKQSVELSGVNEAIKGIDSRSKEGVAEMFRLMRGDGGNVQEQQLGVLEQIAENTAGMGEDVLFPIGA